MKKNLKKQSEKAYTLFVILVGFLILAIYFSQINPARAQNRLDLNDLNTKRELNMTFSPHYRTTLAISLNSIYKLIQ